ncbi:MAG: HEXXH motif-containing putative peptide modification protein, partial [Acidobacteriota bacterium]
CPRGKRPDGALRVAESVIHETMHLQLSLVERVLPLVRDDAVKELASPWKEEKRHPRGILHGLYVFALIYRFWASISVHESGFFKQFALARCQEIGDQLRSIKDFQACEDLTAEGRRFVGGIFEQVLVDDDQLVGHAPFGLPFSGANEVR